MRRVLLVDDNAHVRATLGEMLPDAGYEVTVTSRVAEALTLLESGGFDLVLTDVMLPDGSGLDIALEATRRGVTAIVMTGHPDQMQALERMGHDYLAKPFRQQRLIEAVRSALHD
jgi:DNA-binding response OmpR family regulator